MLKKYSKSTKAAIFSTVYILFYATAFFSGISPDILFVFLLLSPIMVIYFVYAVITDKKESGKKLNEDEFGYQDWDNAAEEKKRPE